MTDFNITAKDLLDNPNKVFDEINKFSPDGLKTSRSKRNVPPFDFTTFNLSEILMRIPAFNSPEDVLGFYETLISGVLGSLPSGVQSMFSGFLPPGMQEFFDDIEVDSGDAFSSYPGDGEYQGEIDWSTIDRNGITPSTRGIDTNNSRPVTIFGAQTARKVLGFDGTIGMWRAGDQSKSDHPKGLAMDLMVAPSNTVATGPQKQMGDMIADFFVHNREALKVSYVIWFRREIGTYTNWQWRTYERGERIGTAVWRHQDHPHVSFLNQPAPVNPSLSWPDGYRASPSSRSTTSQPTAPSTGNTRSTTSQSSGSTTIDRRSTTSRPI